MQHTRYIHHAAVNSQNATGFRQLLAEYEAEHPGVITRHGVGFLGKNYLIFATQDISEVFRQAGIACTVNPLFRR